MLEVLDFYADWCGPCQMMKPIFAELEKEFAGKVKFTIYNVDQNPDQAAQYGVMSIPTYVILQEGKEVDRLIGFTPKAAFAKHLDKYLGQAT
jgi:thioredoxin 1